MHRLIYSALFYLAVPLILLRLLTRSMRAPAYRQRIGERFACTALPATYDRQRMTFWIHAVSVGETVAAAPLVQALRSRYPVAQILITTMTPTGSDRVRALFADQVFHTYLPYDLPGVMQRFVRRVNPAMLILMETELWPNLIHVSRAAGVRLLLANARLSAQSAAGYQHFASATRAMLLQFDGIAAQADVDAQRLLALGADKTKVTVTGSLKFLVELTAAPAASNPVFDSVRNSARPVLIAASTRDREEIKVLTALRRCLQTLPQLLLILVPRHPERFDRVARQCEEFGLVVARRSAGVPITAATQVLVGDSMGEMLQYYRLATIAFVGGSLVNTGCQNVLEPAALGLPVVTGPSQFNFETICAQLEQAGALRTVADEQALADVVIQLVSDVKQQQVMGAAGKALLLANQNALPALMQRIEALLPA
ncbi:MAG: 3-deoxy-D-manno-octulosonic acid transferase [Gammaproteobacteria bacterium]|nr:3-deoxy-D-manno-octulosonic acid transferase [Gammaproteobacteria bacterium]